MKLLYERDPNSGVGLRTFEWPVWPSEVRNLICLPYAGGNSTAFRPLAEALGPTWRVIAVDPPGHGLGVPEAPLDDVPQLCDVLDACLPTDSYAGHYLFGYSVGGYVAHALVSRWEQRGRPGPRGLILGAVNPPQCREQHPRFSEYDDEALLGVLDQLGGIPAALREERAIFDLFKHVVRAGFRAYETAPEPEAPVRTPVLIVGGQQDRFARPAHLKQWDSFCRRLKIELVDGPHVFLPERRVDLARCLIAFAEELEVEP